jgi:transmembrane sensor
MNIKQDERARRIIGEQATQWILDLRHASRDEQLKFTQWLKRSPEHVAEFLRAAELWNELHQVGRGDTTDLQALAAEALASQQDANVVPVDFSSTSPMSLERNVVVPPAKEAGTKGFTKLPAATSWRIAATLVVAIVATAWIGWRINTGPTYTTALGEQRTLRLADGSLMQLNTRSRVQVRFSDHSRDIRLLQGEAFFDVQHDASRPFRVQAGDTVVEAVGTQFNVYRAGEQTKVAVIEGRVRILEQEVTPDVPPQPQLIRAGEALSIAEGRPLLKLQAEEIAAAIAWRERKLVFSGKRLEDVAAEFNRYNNRRIVIADEAARDKLLSGTFNADDPDSLILFLGTLTDISVHSSSEEFVVARR